MADDKMTCDHEGCWIGDHNDGLLQDGGMTCLWNSKLDKTCSPLKDDRGDIGLALRDSGAVASTYS